MGCYAMLCLAMHGNVMQCTGVCKYAHMYVSTHVCLCQHRHTHVGCWYIHIDICLCVYIYIYMYVYACRRIHRCCQMFKGLFC